MTAAGATWTRRGHHPGVVQLQDVPRAMRGLTTIGHDYADVFTAEAGGAPDAPPETWARVVLEGASPAGRFLAWRVACNLQLGPELSPDHVAGWRITGRGEDWLRVEASSWFMTAEGVLTVEPERVTFALFVRYERAAAAVLWPAIAVIHRRAMPGLLRGGVRRMERAGGR